MFQYSFKSLTGGFNHILTGPFLFNGGQIGLGQVTIAYATDRTAHDTAADGSVMVSAITGNSGSCMIEVQQTSALNDFLFGWFNAVTTAVSAGDASQFASATITFVSVNEGVTHILTGVSPSKPPDKVYAAQGAKLTWHLMAANVTTI